MKCGLKTLLVGLTVAVVAAAPTLAQRTGTRLDRNAGAPNNISYTGVKSAILVANGLGQCLARREGKAIGRALEFPLLSAEQDNAVNRRMGEMDECLGDSPEFNRLNSGMPLIVGGISEYFYRVDLKKVDLSSLQGMSDEAAMQTAFRPRTDLEDFGLCVVRRDVAKSQALIAAKPTSKAEEKAIAAITPELGPCLVAGSKTALNTPSVRAVVSFALYRAASSMKAAK